MWTAEVLRTVMTYWQSPLLFCGLFDFFVLWLASVVPSTELDWLESRWTTIWWPLATWWHVGSTFSKLTILTERLFLKFMLNISVSLLQVILWASLVPSAVKLPNYNVNVHNSKTRPLRNKDPALQRNAQQHGLAMMYVIRFAPLRRGGGKSVSQLRCKGHRPIKLDSSLHYDCVLQTQQVCSKP